MTFPYLSHSIRVFDSACRRWALELGNRTRSFCGSVASVGRRGAKEMGQIRILLIDDHDLFRESLKRFLEAGPHFHIAGSCASISEGFAVLDREPIDIVLLDYE